MPWGALYTYIICALSVACTQSGELDVRPISSQGVVGEIERGYVTHREMHQRPEDQSARVAMCLSGGGPRAMLAGSGCITGLEASGVLPSVTYMAGLSGSTWALLPWLLTHHSAAQYKQHLIEQVAQFDPHHVLHTIDRIIPFLVNQSIQNHRFSAIDIYGAFLAETFLHGITSHESPLYDTVDNLHPDPDTHPFALCTSIIPKKNNASYTWMEITPYEVGSHELGYYIPIHTFGSKFNEGQMTKQRPSPTVGYLMGICGSAISASVKELISMYYSYDRWYERALRFSPAKLPNFTRGLDGSPFRHKRKLTCVDAGIEMLLPFPPLIAPGRDVNVIIVCDAGSIIENAPELEKAVNWARLYGKSMPDIDYAHAGSHVCSVFESDDPHTPTIIYLPRIANPSYDPTYNPDAYMGWNGHLNTFNFTYTKEQAQHIAGLMEHAVHEHADTINNAIARKSAHLNNVK